VLGTAVPEATPGKVLGPVISADGMPIVKRRIPSFCRAISSFRRSPESRKSRGVAGWGQISRARTKPQTEAAPAALRAAAQAGRVLPVVAMSSTSIIARLSTGP